MSAIWLYKAITENIESHKVKNYGLSHSLEFLLHAYIPESGNRKGDSGDSPVLPGAHSAAHTGRHLS